ncbi:MAG TPA: hypothetical protein VFK07_02350 [Candidatus Paceibacterota bacterium]|nr:hypothetical protein [Candidatus Paceibacterota bacterium]
MSFLQYLVHQLLLSFYNVTSFKAGDVNFAQLGVNFQNAFIGSQFEIGLQIVALFLCAVLLVAIIVTVAKTNRLTHTIAVLEQTAVPSEPSEGGPVQNRWNEISSHIDSPREGEWKFAVIEADKVVDDQLKTRFPGETMGERLMNIDKTKLLTIDGLWEAHKIRNRLAHDTDYFLRHAEAVRAIHLYEATLKELEVLK